MFSVRPLVVVVLAALSLFVLGGARPAAAQAVSADLFFSEYVEGTSNNKALEIFNGTGAPVDLAAGGYSVLNALQREPDPRASEGSGAPPLAALGHSPSPASYGRSKS